MTNPPSHHKNEVKTAKSDNAFDNFFKEPYHYSDGYGYAVKANDKWEAIDKITAYLDFDEWGDDFMNRLKREIRENMSECWVKWQGYQDDDGEFHNGWVITSEWHGGQRGWKMVYSSDYNRHYVRHGHRLEPKADERGHRVNYTYNEWNCDVCNQINELAAISKHKTKAQGETKE